jgi:hypothetical protein
MNKIELIRKEIEGLRTKYELKEDQAFSDCDSYTDEDIAFYQGKRKVCEEILKLFDCLPEEPDKSLVEEVKRYYSDNIAYISSDQPTLSILTNVARHFAEWGAEHLRDATKMIDKSLEEAAR